MTEKKQFKQKLTDDEKKAHPVNHQHQ